MHLILVMGDFSVLVAPHFEVLAESLIFAGESIDFGEEVIHFILSLLERDLDLSELDQLLA